MSSQTAERVIGVAPADTVEVEGRLRLLEQLDERGRFESLLVDLSATFVNLPADQVDRQIEDGLRKVVEFLGVERSSLSEFSEDKRSLLATHSYVVPGFPPFPPAILDDQFPWYVDMIRRGEVLRFCRIPEDAPAEAVSELAYALRVGLKSNLTIPLRVGGAMLGAIAFGSFRGYRDWPDQLVQRLRLVGEVFANAVARLRADEKMHQLRDQLTRVGRVTTLGELAAAIAHEINQPLCAIVSNAQAAHRLLAAGAPDVAELREALQDIVADSRRAGEVIGRIRALLQKRQPERAPLDLNEAIREVAVLLRHQLTRKGVTLALDLAADLPAVDGDRVQLQQVLLNLMINAAEAMEHAGAGRRKLSVRSARLEGGRVGVTVRDSGPGVAPEHLDRVFDALFTTKPGGMGIGLAISRSIIEAHGGRLWAESDPGGGAAFHFTLPEAGKIPP
jgi:signal transduction histidine kinase